MIAFAILAVVLVASAVFTISAKTPVYSVVGMLANFIILALLYLSLSAEFLGIIQVLVYSGAILMLFVFVIAMLSSGVGPVNVGPDRLPRLVVPGIAIAAACAALAIAAVIRGGYVPPSFAAGGTPAAAGNADAFGSVGSFGQALFTTYLLPFEITAFILLVAIVGVVLLAADAPPVEPVETIKRRAREREPIVKARV